MISTIDISFLRPLEKNFWKFYLNPGDLVELSHHPSIGIIVSLCERQAMVLWSNLDLSDQLYFSPYVPLQVTSTIFKKQ